MSSNEIITAAQATPEYADLVALLERMAVDAGVCGQQENAETCAAIAVAAAVKTAVQGTELLDAAAIDPSTVVLAAVVPAARRAALALEMHGHL